MKYLFTIIVGLLLISASAVAQIDVPYMEPPKEILDLADVSPTPSVSVDSKADWMLLLERPSYKSLAEVAQPEMRLAGLRINPKNYGPSRATYYDKITVKNVASGEERVVTGTPEKLLISNRAWSPDQSKYAFAHTTETDVELWVLDIESASAKKIADNLNAVHRGNPFSWNPKGNSLLVKLLPESRGELRSEFTLPTGPIVQESMGKKAPARTYQDLLQNKTDEFNFEMLATSRLVDISLDGTQSSFLNEGIYTSVEYSPNGDYVLVSSIHTPFSYLIPYYRFPTETSVYDNSGNEVKMVIDVPLIEEMPKGFMATRLGIRSVQWRNDKPATLFWVEALDEGDPQVKVEFRDAMFTLDAPFNGTKKGIGKLQQRFNGINWGTDNLAIVRDRWWNTRNSKIYQLNPSSGKTSLLFDYNYQDRYSDPGRFATIKNEMGSRVLLMSKNKKLVYLIGEGYSPEGNKPFLRSLDPATKKVDELWRANGESTYERVASVIDINKGVLLTSVESKLDNPNYYIRNIKARIAPKQITQFPHPYAVFKEVYKELIHYKRDDGVNLTGTLYLPPGYDRENGAKLPMIMWAYPREHKDASTAGQVSVSPHRFTRLSYGSPIYWVARGYAVLNGAAFPIIGEGDDEPNDKFIEQLVANGKAGIDAVDQLGYIDRERVGVGGHSYGAFMTANLLAHSDLFAAGVARSGAYNRTLTPFGFQSEERTFWEAPDVYFKMSPFMHAHKVNEPLLLVHGEADNNSGTFPMQSERFYNAIKGHGGTVRLTMLPYESHGYRARESVMHTLWEQDSWFEKFVKNKDKLGAGKEKLKIDK